MGTMTVAAERPASPVPIPAAAAAITYHKYSIGFPFFHSRI
jgi:hypothetical protein